MDTSLNAQPTLDIASDIVRIDVRGSLTQQSRPVLMQLIQRVRRMGITSHIRVNLGLAVLVESAALAGLRNDLNAIDGAAALVETAGALPSSAGVSLELNPFRDAPSAAVRPLDLSADFSASIDATGTRPLNVYSDDELLAASDSVFGMMDNPADMARTQLLATYDEIGLEISRREGGLETVRREVGPYPVMRELDRDISGAVAGREPETGLGTTSRRRRFGSGFPGDYGRDVPYEPEVEDVDGAGDADARVLRHAAELKRFSRRSFLIGTGSASVLAADMLFTRRVQAERRVHRILTVPDETAEKYFPQCQLVPLPRLQDKLGGSAVDPECAARGAEQARPAGRRRILQHGPRHR